LLPEGDAGQRQEKNSQPKQQGEFQTREIHGDFRLFTKPAQAARLLRV
jgi:hypothetical protein